MQKGGLLTIRHNEIRDLVSKEFTDVCYGVATDPSLSGVPDTISFENDATTRRPDACPDIVCSGLFGGRMECTFFDVCIFNEKAPSYISRSSAACFEYHEQRKRSKYEERIREVDHSTFCPLVFASTGGAGRVANATLRVLATKISEKHKSEFSSVITWLRTKIGIVLARSISQCFRAPRSKLNAPIHSVIDIELQIAQ